METILLVGIPGSGKSSFYRQRFFTTHVRVSLDLLKTRHRERSFVNLCLESGQRFVVDNTNVTAAERAVYLTLAREYQFSTVAYYFESKIADCLERNASRSGDERVPDVGVLAFAKRLELPKRDEGFDHRFYVGMSANGFVVEDWRDDL